MDSSQTSESSPISDQVWAEMGADSPTLGNVSPDPNKRSRFFDPDELPWQFLGFGLLVLTVISCGALLLLSWNGQSSGWSPEFLCTVGAIAGALGGYLLAPKARFPGFLSGMLAGTSAPSAMYWVLASSLWPNYAMIAGVGLLALLPGLVLYFVIRWLQRGGFLGRTKKSNPNQHFYPELLTDDETTMAIIYAPPSEKDDPQVKELMERLLALCKQDKEVAQRLIEHEQERFPNGRLIEHVRLAIDRLQSDIR